jgi:hypothetical protein
MLGLVRPLSIDTKRRLRDVLAGLDGTPKKHPGFSLLDREASIDLIEPLLIVESPRAMRIRALGAAGLDRHTANNSMRLPVHGLLETVYNQWSMGSRVVNLVLEDINSNVYQERKQLTGELSSISRVTNVQDKRLGVLLGHLSADRIPLIYIPVHNRLLDALPLDECGIDMSQLPITANLGPIELQQ